MTNGTAKPTAKTQRERPKPFMVIQSKEYLASRAGYKTQKTEKKSQKVEQNKSAWREREMEK